VIRISIAVVALVLSWPLAGRGAADFTLSGHDQLIVDTAYDRGTLRDWSGVDIVQGGSVGIISSGNESTVRVSGGALTDYISAFGSSSVTVVGGSVGSIYLSQNATADISGGTVRSVFPDGRSLVSVSGSAVVGHLGLRSWCSADISGGSIGLMSTSLYPVCEDASLVISGGRVDKLLLSLELYGDKKLSISDDNYADGVSLPGIRIAAGTVGEIASSSLSIYDTSVLECSGGQVRGLSAWDSSTMVLSGGYITGLDARENSFVTIIAQDFVLGRGLYMDGQKLCGTGLLSGTWMDGTTWRIGVSANEPNATILLVPEPASLALLAVGGLAVMRRRRRS